MIVSGGRAFTFASQALGETTPSLTNGYFYGSDRVNLTGMQASYAALYRAQPSIATVVDKVANAAARLSLRVWDKTPATGKLEDTTSAYARLIAGPSTFLSPFNFWRWTISTYELYGEAFWYKQRDANGAVVELVPMHPSRTIIKRNEDGEVFYQFSVGGVGSAALLEAGRDDVVPFLRYNPDSLMRGLSRLEPLRSTLLSEDAARRGMAAFYRNGLRPSVFLQHPGELSEAAHNRIKKGIEASHAGVDSFGKAAVLEEGMTASIVQLSAEDMQYVEARKLNLQEACMVFDVPPPVVHILDHATFSNITEQMRSMYRDTMAPRLEDVESVIDFYLRPDFFPADTHRATFALDEVLRGDFETRADSVNKLITAGVMMPSEARPLFDLPDAGEVAAHLYANAALVPLGSSVHGQEEVSPAGSLEPSVEPMGVPHPPPAPVAPPPPKRFSARAVDGRLGRAKAAGGDVRAALIEEHRTAIASHFADQKVAAEAGDPIDTKAFDDALAGLLAGLGEATAKAIGATVAKQLGGTGYDVGAIADWLHSNAIDSAKQINATTAAALNAYLATDDPDATAAAYFDGPGQSRADSVAASRVLVVASLASLSSASQHGAATKTWITGPNPRPEHAQMDGETVGIDDLFSNGMNMPGDPAGGADEVAGCNCDVEFNF